MIFTSESQDKGSRRARAQEVNATMPAVPQYMHWSDFDISWSIKDHPSILTNPGSYLHVVDALVAGPKFSCKFSRVLIDGGSTINILYRDTMIKLGLSERDLERSGLHSMELFLVCHVPRWGASDWMSSLDRRKTSGGSRFGLRW